MTDQTMSEKVTEVIQCRVNSLQPGLHIQADTAAEWLGDWTEEQFQEFTAFVVYGQDHEILEVVLKREFFEEVNHAGLTCNVWFTYDGEYVNSRDVEDYGEPPEHDFETLYSGRLQFDGEGLVIGGWEAIERLKLKEENAAAEQQRLQIERINQKISDERIKLIKIKEKISSLERSRSELQGHVFFHDDLTEVEWLASLADSIDRAERQE